MEVSSVLISYIAQTLHCITQRLRRLSTISSLEAKRIIFFGTGELPPSASEDLIVEELSILIELKMIWFRRLFQVF